MTLKVIINDYSPKARLLNAEYLPRRSRGKYSAIFTEPDCYAVHVHIVFVYIFSAPKTRIRMESPCVSTHIGKSLARYYPTAPKLSLVSADVKFI